MRPAKKKMTKRSEAAQRIKRLREETLHENQAQFAERLDVDQARISEYETEKRTPTAEAYAAMGNLAPYPENIWFWEQIGIEWTVLVSSAEKILKERVEIPLARKTPEGIEKAQIVSPILLPERFVPNPDSTVCLVVDEKSAGLVFAEGDVVVLEPASDPQEPQPYWKQIVLVEFTERGKDWWNWPTGLFMGRLHCKRYALTDLTYYATVGPFNDSERTWQPGRGESITIGQWSYKSPLPIELQGRIRGRVKNTNVQHDGKLYVPGDMLELLIRDAGVLAESNYIELEPKDHARAMRAAGLLAKKLGPEELERVRKDAKKDAPEKLRVAEGCKIIGRVVAWFGSQKEQQS